MKYLFLLLSVVLISTNVSSANLNNNKKPTSSLAQAPIYVTVGTDCGKYKFIYNPQPGMTEEQIENDIAATSWLISQFLCPPFPEYLI